jgi:release factor glutamine methyltransferase
MTELTLPQSLGPLKQAIAQLLAPVCMTAEQVTAERDLFLEHCFKINKTAQYQLVPETYLEEESLLKLKELLHNRIRHRQPIQYLLGEGVFHGLRFNVSPSVLIPRPETEGLLEGVLKRLKTDTPRILDLGTGSGILAICLQKHLPKAVVHAVDCSHDALEVARTNAQKHNTPVSFFCGNWYTALPEEDKTPYDIIVSNPPYIDSHAANTLTPEVLHHEPHQALFSPDTPEALYLELIQEGASRLTPQGLMGFELGLGVSEKLLRKLIESPMSKRLTWAIENDYAKIPRYLWLDKKTSERA